MSGRRSSLFASAMELFFETTSLVLPRPERNEWTREWRAELHHIVGRGISPKVCIAFALGAFPDALWIRRHSRRSGHLLESPRRCVAILAVPAALSITLTLLLPQVRPDIFPPKYEGPSDLVTISPVPSVVGSEMEVSTDQYLRWASHGQPGLSQTAFYYPVTVEARVRGHELSWGLGESTADLANLLHVPIPKGRVEACKRIGATPIILSRDAWKHDFACDPNVVGHMVRISGRPAVIVAIAPLAASDLPLQMDAWSLESDQAIHTLAFKRFAYGYMIAQLAPGSFRGASRRGSRIEMFSDDGERTRLYIVGLPRLAEYHRRIPTIDFLLSLFIACLMVPAIMAVCLGTCLRAEKLSLRMRTKGWMFLGAKIALLLPILYCGPLLIAHAAVATSRGSRHELQTLITVCACLLAALWIIDDQRQRCPHCLRVLTNPARVGDRSRCLLSFSGMEYACSEGHGLMHVPDYPTSWFASQRWLALDASWRTLFQHGT